MSSLVLLIIFYGCSILSNIIISVCLAIRAKKTKRKIEQGQKVECCYEVRDSETYQLYIYGVKDKILKGFGGPKKLISFTGYHVLYEYSRDNIIKGKACKIYYFVNAQTLLMSKRKVTKKGRIMGLR